MVVSAIFILDSRGKVLISRNYRGDVPMFVADRFITLLQDAEDGQSVTPVLQDGGYHYLYIRHSNIYLLAVTRKNANAASIFVFLHRLIQVFKDYFRELEEESIRDNFVIIYELLDEMIDFGYPQFTESKILREYILQEGFKLEHKQVKPPIAVTNTISWRSDGIKYRKNEVFLDVIESVNLLMGSSDIVLSSEILGVVKMRCDLSGMPELKLGLNEKILFESPISENANSTSNDTKGRVVEMEDIKFHQCVRLTQFEHDRTISFIPPDGEFELMSYRLATTLKPLIWSECVVNVYSGTRTEILLKIKGQFKKRSIANNVELSIPVAEDAYSPQYKMSGGSCIYAPERNVIVWKIKQLPGGKECWLKAQYKIPTIRSEEQEKKRPISVKFDIPYFTTSGIQVRYLKITEKSGYQALPWVRYITQNGDYYLRFPEPNIKQTLRV